MRDVYEKTQQKMRQLYILGYNVIKMWECEWTRLKQTSPDIQTYVDSLQFVDPLNPRDAFCGGRTDAIKLYHHVTPGQKIHYIDHTSLYPWVNKTCVYPTLNIFVASFTTSRARDRLYEALQLLRERVLYYDNDSVIYLEEPGQPNPPLEDYLGESTSELEADDYVEEFVSGSQELWVQNQEGQSRMQSP